MPIFAEYISPTVVHFLVTIHEVVLVPFSFLNVERLSFPFAVCGGAVACGQVLFLTSGEATS